MDFCRDASELSYHVENKPLGLPTQGQIDLSPFQASDL